MKFPFLFSLLHSAVPFAIIWKAWGYSSAGRAFEWHSKGQRFDPAYLHHAFNPPHLSDVVLFIHSPHRNKWLTRFHASFYSFGIGSLLCRCLISLFQRHVPISPLHRHKWLTRFHASLRSFEIGLPFAILGTKLISSETCWFIPIQTAKKNGASCTTFQKSD